MTTPTLDEKPTLDEEINIYLRGKIKPILDKPKDRWLMAECCEIYQLGHIFRNWSAKIEKELAGWTPEGESEAFDKNYGTIDWGDPNLKLD